MKKGTIVSIILVVVLIGLLIFAGTREYKDTLLRYNNIRVRVPENTLIVDGCDEQNAIYCKKNVEVDGKTHTLEFSYEDFRENGYPNKVVATIDSKEFYQKEGLNIEVNSTNDYPVFLNFKVMDSYIVFTFTDGAKGRETTLYAIDVNGKIVLEEKEIDDDDMKIKDYTDFITYEDNVINIYASKLDNDAFYNDESICNVSPKKIVEANYTYTLKNGKFTKKQISKKTAKEFTEEKEINCEWD